MKVAEKHNLFVVYFSFAPVISANIHRYVNYSDIQFLIMVTETKRLRRL